MREVAENADLVAYCGLYCGSCRAYLKEKCPGCQKNVKAGWCKVRTCCIENQYKSCVDCTSYTVLEDCRKLNNLIAKFFALVFRSNRFGSLAYIKKNGYDAFAHEMTENKSMTVKK